MLPTTDREAPASDNVVFQFTRKQLDFFAQRLSDMALAPVAEAQLRLIGTSGIKHVFQLIEGE